MTIHSLCGKNVDMRAELWANIIQVSGKLCSDIIQFRVRNPSQPTAIQPATSPPVSVREITEDTGEDKIEKGTACLPCVNSHLHACGGLLNEGLRMSPDGLNTESMLRVDKCLFEIAAAERVDLAVENVAGLPEDEREIAEHASRELRDIRHGLEGLNTKEELEILTLQTTNLQKYVGKEYFKLRLAKMPKEKKAELVEKTIEMIEQEE